MLKSTEVQFLEKLVRLATIVKNNMDLYAFCVGTRKIGL